MLFGEARVRKLAHDILRMAIKRGKIKRLPREKCEMEPAQGHHEDYDKPLEVVWLCKRCHRILHLARRLRLKRLKEQCL